MKGNRKRLPAFLILTVILISGFAATGLSFSPSLYVDANSGYQVNRNSAEYTVYSYYQLLENKSFDGAYQLFTPELQKMTTPQDLASQFRNVKVTSTKLTKVFTGIQVHNFAAVSFIRNLSVPNLNEDQVVVGTHFLTRDSFGNRWSIIGMPTEIPSNLQIDFYQGLLKYSENLEGQVLALEGYSAQQKASILKQVRSQTVADQAQLRQLKNTAAIKLDPINLAQEFINEYAPEMSYIYTWVEPEVNKFNNIPNHPEIGD